MLNIEQRNGCVFYYGNPAGYIDRDTAVMDAMFKSDELEHWLEQNRLAATWMDGVYERLANGNTPDTQGEIAPVLKKCRIWQLVPGAAAWKDIVCFGKSLPEPQLEDYSVVYDGQVDTNDLEGIYDRFTERSPSGFSGHPLSVSDLVELFDSGGSTFYFLDRTHFRKVDFPEQAQTMQMTI